MSIIALDPGTTFGIGTDIPRGLLMDRFKKEYMADNMSKPVMAAPDLNITTFCLADQPDAKKAGMKGILPKDSQPWERFKEFRQIIKGLIFLADMGTGPHWFLIEKTVFVRSVKQGIYALGFYAHYCEMVHVADQGFYEILTPELKNYIFRVMLTTGEKMKRNKENSEQIIREYYPAVRNDHEAHAAAMVRMFNEQIRGKVE